MRGGSGGHRHASHHKSKPPGIKLWGDHWVLAEERRRTAASLLQLHIWSVLHPLPCSCWQAVEETSRWRMWSSSPVRGSVEDCHTTAAEWADYVNPGQPPDLQAPPDQQTPNQRFCTHPPDCPGILVWCLPVCPAVLFCLYQVVWTTSDLAWQSTSVAC